MVGSIAARREGSEALGTPVATWQSSGRLQRSLAEAVADELRDAIVRAELPHGSRILEEEIAQRLDVSRGPARDAVRTLIGEGLIRKVANRGTFVEDWTARDVTEVYTLRRSLELLAIESMESGVDESALVEMQRCIDRMAAMDPRSMSERDAARLDVDFHAALCAASGHSRVASAWAALRTQLEMFLLRRNLADSDFRDLAVDSHQQLLDVIVEGDLKSARDLLEEHLSMGHDRVIATFQVVSSDG